MAEMPDADVLVVGGGLGGIAAALGAAATGARVVLTEESGWLGGQLTTQATPPDEHPWIETRGSTALYRSFRQLVRHLYGHAGSATFNPGRAWVSGLSHPPVVAVAALEAMLAPHQATGRVRVLRSCTPIAVHTTADVVDGVTFRTGGEDLHLRASYVLDATERGDLLPLGGVEHVVGSESSDETGEPHAGPVARPDNVQAMTVPFALEHRPGENHVIDEPADYARWREYRPAGWPARMLSWTAPDARTLEARTFCLEFGAGEHHGAGAPADVPIDLWSYRRVVHPDDGAPGPEATVVNWPMNDYVLGHVLGDPASAARHVAGARALSLSLLYWLQTEAPRPDGGLGYPGLLPRGDLMGSADGLSLRPYLRESRRIRAEYTVTENDVSVEVRGAHGATRHADSVGTGAYRIDLHPSTGGDPFIDIPTYPFEIPLGALLPVRMENLLPAAKNLGTTHVSNGCYRLHPVEWTIGEAAGRLASYCLRHATRPRLVGHNPRHLTEFQNELTASGFGLHWPEGTAAL